VSKIVIKKKPFLLRGGIFLFARGFSLQTAYFCAYFCFFHFNSNKKIMQTDEQNDPMEQDNQTIPVKIMAQKVPIQEIEDEKYIGKRDKNGNENHLHPTEPRWFAIRTRFRDEKVAIKILASKGIEYYLPIKKLSRRYGKKVRHVDMPLISSFVFVKIVKDQYIPVLQSEYVAGFLKFGNNLLSIPEKQINILRRLLGEDVDIDIEVVESGLTKGDVVEITSGPLLGIQGVLINVHGKEKVVIDLVNSGYALHLEVEKSLLRKIN
jgi:transcriptional antiterminator RfaH